MRNITLLFSFVLISTLSFSQGYMHSGKDNMSVALFDSGGVRHSTAALKTGCTYHWEFSGFAPLRK